MQRILDQAVANWETRDDVRFPLAVDGICPYCARRVTFPLNWSGPIDTRAMPARSRCPGCSGEPVFVLVDLQDSGLDDRLRTGTLYVYPAAAVREPLSGLATAENLPEPVKRAYVSAVTTYNSREWAATAVICRRTLEGITRTLLGTAPQRLPLARQLQMLPEKVNLGSPVSALAQALKQGGNLGAHIELQREPDEAMATLMIDLLDDLIEYLFILPSRIAELERKVRE